MPLPRIETTMSPQRLISATLFLALATTTSIYAQDPPPPAVDFVSEQWKEFVSSDGAFKASMPGTPTEMSQPIDAKPGDAVAHFHALTTKAAEYTIGFTTFARDLESMQSSSITLDGIRDRILVKESGKLLSESDVSLDGHPGRALVIEVNDGMFRDQYFLVANRLYTVSVFTPTVNATSPADVEGIRKAQETIAKRFFDSFKLLSK
jgi:hypothetical protein